MPRSAGACLLKAFQELCPTGGRQAESGLPLRVRVASENSFLGLAWARQGRSHCVSRGGCKEKLTSP